MAYNTKKRHVIANYFLTNHTSSEWHLKCSTKAVRAITRRPNHRQTYRVLVLVLKQ